MRFPENVRVVDWLENDPVVDWLLKVPASGDNTRLLECRDYNYLSLLLEKRKYIGDHAMDSFSTPYLAELLFIS